MTYDVWSAVDAYIDSQISDDEVLSQVQAAADEGGLPPINVTAAQGKFLALLVRMTGARTVLEVGTLGGYSTTWLARALPEDGHLVTLEADPRHADVALRAFAAAGVADRVRLVLGKAADSLPQLAAEGFGPVDLVFIDADKANNPTYLGWAVKLARPGTVIVVDNVIRDGAVLDADSDDPGVVGSRATFDLLASHPRLDATALQTVGAKGYDGFALALVR